MDKKAAISEQTKQKLKESFLELCEKGGMSAVTIGAITKKAGYNRSTFYNHYDDLRAMLDEIEDDVIEQAQKKIASIFSNGIPKDISSIFSLTFPVFEKYSNMIYILLGENGDAAFLQRLRKMVKDSFREMFINRLNAEQTEYILAFVSSSVLGLFEHWHETGKKYSSDEFLKLAHSLLATGVLGQLSDNTVSP